MIYDSLDDFLKKVPVTTDQEFSKLHTICLQDKAKLDLALKELNDNPKKTSLVFACHFSWLKNINLLSKKIQKYLLDSEPKNYVGFHNYMINMEKINLYHNYNYSELRRIQNLFITKIRNEIILKKLEKYPKTSSLSRKIKKHQEKLKLSQVEYDNIFSYFSHRLIARNVMKLEKITVTSKTTRSVKKESCPYVIDLKNVDKYYYNKYLAVKVLSDVNLQIKSGEFVVILGASGSGKTTLLNIISGMDNASYGKTSVLGKNLIHLSDKELVEFRRQHIGFIFQQYGLLPLLTVKENVEVGQHLQKNEASRINVNDALQMVGMYEHQNKYPSELSGGQQQRVSIARIIAKNPQIIFGDEPTGAIDEKMSKQILQLFVDINKKFKTTIIIVTHNSSYSKIANRILRVGDGKIISDEINPNPISVQEL